VREKDPLEKAIEVISQLPGFGEKSASRLVYWLAGEGNHLLPSLVSALTSLKDQLKTCSVCGDFSFSDPCEICQDPNRDAKTIMVVEDGKARRIIEKTGIYQGRYHILGGLLSPRLGIGPEKLRIKQLMARIEREKIKEVVIALSSSQEGEATAQWLIQKLSSFPVRLTRLARGMPLATMLEYLDPESLKLAIKERKEIT